MPLQEEQDAVHQEHCRSLGTLLDSCPDQKLLQQPEQEQVLLLELQLLQELQEQLLLACRQQNLSMEAFLKQEWLSPMLHSLRESYRALMNLI